MNPLYPFVADRANHRCEYCHAPEATARAGSSAEHNLALACRACNLYKSDATVGIDPETGEAVRLFHPEVDRFEDHFIIEIDGLFTGTSAVGRATIIRLRMNAPRQVAARRQWSLLKLFP